VARRLEAAGFSRQGRHWVHEEGQVFVELPGAGLDPDERAVFTQVAGWMVLILSPEDILVDRLAAWQFWKSPMDAVAAFWVWQSMGSRVDTSRLRAAAERKGVEPEQERHPDGRSASPPRAASTAAAGFQAAPAAELSGMENPAPLGQAPALGRDFPGLSAA
jgi:hypothetical protein